MRLLSKPQRRGCTDKRSTDGAPPNSRAPVLRSLNGNCAGGATWSPLKILHWVENRTRGQPTPVVDNVTGTIFMAFDDNLSGKTTGSTLITSSQDDGLTWSNATAIPKAGGGVIASPNSGLGRGFVIYNASLPSKTRLILPTESGAMYSDGMPLCTWKIERKFIYNLRGAAFWNTVRWYKLTA